MERNLNSARKWMLGWRDPFYKDNNKTFEIATYLSLTEPIILLLRRVPSFLHLFSIFSISISLFSLSLSLSLFSLFLSLFFLFSLSLLSFFSLYSQISLFSLFSLFLSLFSLSLSFSIFSFSFLSLYSHQSFISWSFYNLSFSISFYLPVFGVSD